MPDRDPTTQMMIDAQADLATALGFYRLEHGEGDPTEQRLATSLHKMRSALYMRGVHMAGFVPPADLQAGSAS